MTEQNYGYTPEQIPPTEAEPEAERKGTSKKILKYGGFVLGGLLLFGLGASAGGGGNSGDRPEPEVIEIEKEVEVIKEVEVPGEATIKEVEVERVPDVCKAALDAADDWIGMGGEVARIAGDLIGMIPRAAEAGMNLDAAGIEQLTAELEIHTKDVQALTSQAEKNKYPQYRDECLSK